KARFGKLIAADPARRDFIDHLLAYLTGQITDAALLATIESAPPAMQSVQACEAHYFIGWQKQLAEGPDAAAVHFEQALATDARHLSAFRGAAFALKKFPVAR
ncbi:MAG: hypothetical protein ACREJB_11765, partial [Planctomycetaceae bacterium]